MAPAVREVRLTSQSTEKLENKLNELFDARGDTLRKLMDVREKQPVEEDEKIREELGKIEEKMSIISTILKERERERENQQGGKRTRKNKKSHKKRTHKKRTKRTRHTRKH